MSTRTNSILRYIRPRSVWLCPDCDAENELTETSCFLCGCGKTISAVIVNPIDNFDFNETDKEEYKPGGSSGAYSPVSGGSYTSSLYPPSGSTSAPTEDLIPHGRLSTYEYEPPADKKRNVVSTVLIAILITIGLLLFGLLLFMGINYNVSKCDSNLIAENTHVSCVTDSICFTEFNSLN